MIGTILGNRYELLEKIGEGGMAEVYKAKCHLLNRYVAVKILKSQFVDNMEFVGKFKQEAASAASLSHNNIVSIYDIGSEKNINYIVMEYINGKTLKEIINEQKVLGYNEAIILAIQIGKALECAHKNNIIHRDVKPHNILVTKEGVVKVTDFGIAKATSSVTITNSDRILGSAHYFSPEQAKGNFVDCKTDIYSLGIILYEMLTGKVPYDGDSPVSVAIKHIQEQVKPPKEVNPKIPESLNRLILKAIEKEQFRRYQSATEILNDLQKIKENPNVELSMDNRENEYTMIMKPIHDYEDEDIEYNETENTSGGISMKKKKILIVSLIAITVILVGFISAYMLSGGKLNEVNKPTGTVIVPEIIGLDKEEAQRLVEEKDLKFVATTESSDKPAGVVIKCYPYPGTEIDRSENDEVRVILSSGPKVSSIPNLIEIEFEAAKEYLKAYNLNLGNVTYVFSDTIDKGKVADQSPKPTSPIGTNTTVDLVVSKGSETKMTKVPNLVNKNVDEAEELIVNAKLKLGVLTKIKTQDESKDGIVTVQSLEPNKEVKENTVINLSYYVFSDKSLIIVPNFVNKTVKEAHRIAQNYDLILDVSGRDDFIITAQDTYAGKEVEAGTVVKLTSEPNP